MYHVAKTKDIEGIDLEDFFSVLNKKGHFNAAASCL